MFRRAPQELALDASTLVAFGSTRKVKGKVDSDDTLRHLLAAGTSTVCIVGKAWDYHVLEALQTTLDEGVAMVVDSVAFLRADGRDVFFDAEHFFDGYRRNPEFSLRVLEGAAEAGRHSARALRHERRHAAPRGRADGARGRRLLRRRRRHRRPPPRRRRHRRRQRARGRPRRGDPGAGHDQRLRRAHRQLQPHHDHPEPHVEDGHRDDPRGSARAAHAGRAPRGRAGEHGAQPAGGVRGRLGVRAQGRAARERDHQAPRRVRARTARLRRQRHALRGVGARGQEHAAAQGEGARPHARRPSGQRARRHAQAHGARGLPLRGRRRVARAPHAARDGLGTAMVRGGVVPRHHRRRQPVFGHRRRHHGSDASRCTSAASG